MEELKAKMAAAKAAYKTFRTETFLVAKQAYFDTRKQKNDLKAAMRAAIKSFKEAKAARKAEKGAGGEMAEAEPVIADAGDIPPAE